MKRLIWLVALLLMGVSSARPGADILEQILVKVNGAIIT